jgi:negative regulator of flagellin synthesis FlgM
VCGDKIMDKISNNTYSNIQKNISKSKQGHESSVKSVSKITTEVSDNIVNLNQTKLLVADLAKSAPINSDKVQRIKDAISSGNYPIDVDKVTDALMQAYKEMKS